MSREIVILRHAQAEPNAGTQRDFDRTLSPRGREEAMAVAKWFDEHGVRFDRVVSSPATRALVALMTIVPPGVIGLVFTALGLRRLRQLGPRPAPEMAESGEVTLMVGYPFTF